MLNYDDDDMINPIFQSSTIGGKHLLLLNQFMNLFGMPPLLGGSRDGLKIGSIGQLLIVTEVQVGF